MNMFNFTYKEIDFIFVDLDNTLVFTNEANNYAYRKAIEYFENFTGKKIFSFTILSLERITKDILFDKLVSSNIISSNDLLLISTKKEEYYHQFLFLTKVNKPLFNHLVLTEKTYENLKIFMVTNSSKYRADLICNYHSIHRIFKNKYFLKSKQKYNDVISLLNIDKNRIFIFEDDEEQIKSAIEFGIPESNFYQQSIGEIYE